MLLSIIEIISMEAAHVSPSKAVETETFWKRHYELQKASDLSRVEYCKQHDLNYDRFGYWISKWNRNQGNKLVSVKLRSTSESVEQPILCTLDLKSGNRLKIHDTKALSIVLEKYC